MSVREVADWLRLSPHTVYSWVKSGYLAHRRLPPGKIIQIDRAALQRWLDGNTHEAQI